MTDREKLAVERLPDEAYRTGTVYAHDECNGIRRDVFTMESIYPGRCVYCGEMTYTMRQDWSLVAEAQRRGDDRP